MAHIPDTLERCTPTPLQSGRRSIGMRSFVLLCLLFGLALLTVAVADPTAAAADDSTIGTEMDDIDGAFNMGLGIEVKEAAAPAACPTGTHRVGSECMQNQGCTAHTCSGNGLCSQVDGYVRCHCEPGFVTMGFDGLHCNACDSPQAVYPHCATADLIDERRRDTLSTKCKAALLPHTLNQAGYLPPATEDAGPTEATWFSWQLRQHSMHLIDWFWMNVEAGSAEITFTIAHDSLLRLHISKMSQVVRSPDTALDIAHQHIDGQLGAHDSRLTVIPSLYSSTSFLQSGTTILQRNEVALLRRLTPGQYKLLLEYDSRLTPNFLLESCPKFLMELEIEPEEAIKARLGIATTTTTTTPSKANPHLPQPICPETSRLPHIEYEGESLMITSDGFRFGQKAHRDHAAHTNEVEPSDALDDHSSHNAQVQTYTDWFTVNAKDDVESGLNPHGRPIYSLPFVIPDVIGFQAFVSSRLEYQFGIGQLRMGLTSGLAPAFTFAQHMWSDSHLDSNELHVPLAPGKYFLNIFEPLPQLPDLTGPCSFFTWSFEVSWKPVPGLGNGAAGDAEQRRMREIEQVGSMSHEVMCPYQVMPVSLSTPGWAGLHGSDLHIAGMFRVDFEGNLGSHHDMHFATSFLHASPFMKHAGPPPTVTENHLLRVYIPQHETNLKFHIELIRLTDNPHSSGPADRFLEKSIHSLDTSVWDSLVVDDLEAGEYILRFKLSDMSFKPNDEYCEGFRMEMSVLPNSRARVTADCVASEPDIPDCPAIPYSSHTGFGAAPYATLFDRAAWDGGSSDLASFPLEIRYRDTILDMSVFSDFARAPVAIVLKTLMHGDQQEPLIDTSLTHSKLRAHREAQQENNKLFTIPPTEKDKFTSHAQIGRQLKKNTQSLRTVLKPGHYMIHIRLLAPAGFSLLQTGMAGASTPLEAHHVCVPYSFQLTLESAVPIALQQQACMEKGDVFILPTLLNTLEFQRTETDLTDMRLSFAHKFLLPHAHERQDGAQPFDDQSGENSDQVFFWLENLTLVHLVLEQFDQGLRLLLISHPKCDANPDAGQPPMHHVNGLPYRDLHPMNGKPVQHPADKALLEEEEARIAAESTTTSLLEVGHRVSDRLASRTRTRSRAGPTSVHPAHAADGDAVTHSAGFSPEHHRPVESPPQSHPGQPADDQPMPAEKTDLHGHDEGFEHNLNDFNHAAEQHDATFTQHECDNVTIFESTESTITLHRYLLPGLYSFVIEETELSRQDAELHAPYRSCPYYHMQLSLASVWDLEKVSSNLMCNVAGISGSSGGIENHISSAPNPTAGMDSWPPDTPRKITRPYLFDSIVSNRSLHFQQKLGELRAESMSFTVDTPFHLYAEVRYDFYLAYLTLDLMSLDSKRMINFAGRTLENGYMLLHSFLPKGDYILTISEGKKSMEETPIEIMRNAAAHAPYTLHHVPGKDHPGFQCVEFSFKMEIVPVSSFAVGLSSLPSDNSVAGEHHSLKARMVSDAVHPHSATTIAESIAAQQLLHFASTHLPNFPFLPRSLCSARFMRDVVDADIAVDLFGIFSLNTIAINEEPEEQHGTASHNGAHTPNKITFTLSTTSIFRLFAMPYANRDDPDAARAFVLSTSLTHELDSSVDAADGAATPAQSQPMEMQTSEPPAPGTHDHFSWMFGTLYPGTYTLVLQPIVLPSHRAIYSSGVFGRMNWFESVIQLAISPVREDQESMSPHSCTLASAVPACAESHQLTPDAKPPVEENMEWRQSDATETFHHVAPSVPVCPLQRGDRIVLVNLHLDRRSDLTVEVASDFLSNDVLLSVIRFGHGKVGWGLDRFLGHRSPKGQDLSLVLPPGDYGITVHSLGTLAKLPFIFGCGSVFRFEAHVEPAVHDLKHGLIAAKPTIHINKQNQPHPAIQHTNMDPNSAQHACPPFSLFPASLFDSQGQESDLYLKHSRHSARLHGERFEVNEPNADAKRFHYLQITIDVVSVLRIDIRTPSGEYEKHVGVYTHHNSPDQMLVEPSETIAVDPRLTTIVWVLTPERLINQPSGPSGHASDALFHPRTSFLLSIGGTASAAEWSVNGCPFIGIDLVLVPLDQLREHIVPAPDATNKQHGHHAHTCQLMHNNAPAITPKMGRPVYQPIWWSGLQKSLSMQFSVTDKVGATAVIILQHSFISALFHVELVSVETDVSIPLSGRSYVGSSESMVSSEKVTKDTYHPVDLFFTRDYSVTVRALLATGTYNLVIRELMSGALAAVLGVHQDELCLPAALIASIELYEPTGDASGPMTGGIHMWPVHVPHLPPNEILIRAGQEDHTLTDSAATPAGTEPATIPTQEDVNQANSIIDAIDQQQQHPQPHHPVDDAHVLPDTFDHEHTVTDTNIVHPITIPHHTEPDHAADGDHHAADVDHAPVHPLDEPEDDVPQFDSRGLERDSDDLIRGGRQSPSHPDYTHPVVGDLEFADSYRMGKLRDHLREHHPDDPDLKKIEEHGHYQNPDVINIIKEKSSRFFEHGGRLIRSREYSALDITVFTLALLVTLALCCVALTLHCRCGTAVLACLGRILPTLCPCFMRFFVVKKLKNRNEIQLKKTLYYDNSNMGDDDNL